ncbi:alpha-1,3-mannosyltransferase CMT1 [Aspergillus sclerotiicarbonarius CBS 121057]|uniref:Alpha-1,3-mannosyltransferase CMT1 n=1 Tax=Aspergillus sclerotiicarbonarius (strain CBS 121057 / IBT 28362) TaxID=1448318 RepID=A0A319F089_ASPSB|nr:alpha-1,3-mannosyltransferase CMT1 [Aspergillus sclerotiicarbonarius CBS 121057]
MGSFRPPKLWRRLSLVLGALMLLCFLYSAPDAGWTQWQAATAHAPVSACTGFDLASVSEDLHARMKAQSDYTPAEIGQFVCGIVNHTMSASAQLECPATISPRYQSLIPTDVGTPEIAYYVALNLHQMIHIILPLMGSILEAIRYLGPEHCFLSIVEGRSTDGTYEILAGLKPELDAMGVRYYLSRSPLNPLGPGENRIKDLAELRNMALEPLITGVKQRNVPFDHDPMIIFINDIGICPEDILELAYQQKMQAATMTCAFDWREEGVIHDVWVSRDLAGDLFFDISSDGRIWDSHNLFSHHEDSRRRFSKQLPVQVFSCWGGMVTLDSGPFIDGLVQFRYAEENDCYQGEPTLLAQDLWRQGLGKVLAVPAVNVAYEYRWTLRAKQDKGYVHDIVNKPRYKKHDELVRWQDESPEKIKCMPSWDRQSWVDAI